MTKAKFKDSTPESVSHQDRESFRLAENVNINLLKAKSKDFYWLIIHCKNNDQHLGPRRWNKTISENKQTGERYLDRFEKYARKTS